MVTAHRPLAIGSPVYDSANGRLMVLGYTGQNWGGINVTWLFDGHDWTVSSAFTPDGNSVMVDDPALGGVVLIAQPLDPAQTPPTTWLWNGAAWRNLNLVQTPSPVGASLGYYAPSKQVLLFGGNTPGGQSAAQTWLFDGRSWQPAPAP